MKEEVIEVIYENGDVRAERICSFGAISPDGFYYDQKDDEFVMLIKGEAELEVLKETIRLKEGDFLYIKAHQKHKVIYTSEDAEWLCLYLKNVDYAKNYLLISACLCGIGCRYDAKAVPYSKYNDLKDEYNLIPVCPEMFGGLKAPRECIELNNGRAYDSLGNDYTENILRGTDFILKLSSYLSCKKAVFKDKSPSCGNKIIYDGSFNHIVIPGEGIAAGILRKQGIEIKNEND